MTSVDPRVERSREVILDATLDELAEVGYGAFTIEGVARRAGVGKATIYRHWDGKLGLVSDAVTVLEQIEPPAYVDASSNAGDLRARIVEHLRRVAEHFATSRLTRCLPAIIDASERDEAVRQFHHRTTATRRAVMMSMLGEARAAGHLAPELDLGIVAEALVGPIFVRRLLTGAELSPDLAEALVATLLDPHWI